MQYENVFINYDKHNEYLFLIKLFKGQFFILIGQQQSHVIELPFLKP